MPINPERKKLYPENWDKMTLKEYIFDIFGLFHKGKAHAIKRREFLLWTRVEYGNDITDREMRKAYEDLPICGSSQGLYLPETQAEIDEQVELHKKKIIAYWRKIKVLKRYKIDSDPIQKELF